MRKALVHQSGKAVTSYAESRGEGSRLANVTKEGR